MNTNVLAYLLIACYFVIERLLRKGEQALSLQPGQSDRGSSRLIWATGLFNLFIILIAPVLNFYRIGNWENNYLSWFGLALMIIGLIIRFWAAKTLGKLYTRTLQILEDHHMVNQGLYSIIRHPGYLGTFIMDIGAGFAVSNWFVLIIILLTGLTVRVYRVKVEEEMLEASLGEQYKTYCETTWRLIPFIY
ncbi:isoprenylcysteine carboxyl methyltransferase [Calothrix sp. NIES-4071]|nr:isoprenylcysteine carboxyl methyltransferase [Calothrix sp. NIES-4071]BAZ56345.1 isoprenylcysteine carboxyl methyltransferase [Calothrix sp. NIES-4105]